MNPQENNLSQALRELAEAAPQGATPELGERLEGMFARHHAQRRVRRVTFVAGIAACLLLAIGWMSLGRKTVHETTAQQPRQAAPSAPQVTAPVAPPALVAHDADGEQPRTTTHATARRAKIPAPPAQVAHRAAPPAVVASGDFVALPQYDPAIPIGQSRVVRLDMSGSALQLIGYPVDEDLMEKRVLTDVVVGQDGVPYAVRFVQTRSVR